MGLPEPARRAVVPTFMVVVAFLACCPVASTSGSGSPPAQEGVPSYPVGVGAVALDVLVTDRDGDFVEGLRASDFRVLEQGVPQQLTFFTADRTPVTVVVLLDSSASVRSHLLSVQKAANRFIDKLERGDRARVGFFHEQVVLGPRFTDDMDEHAAMIKRMRAARSTHLYDALVESFDLLRPVERKKSLLVFSDGDDQGSRTSRQDALEAARRSHVSVYAVGLVGWSAAGGMHTNQELLEQVAQLTGGRAFFPEDERDIRKAFDRIRDELHNQYRMGYVPSGGDAGPAEWREIQVEVPGRKNLAVRTRLGYYGDSPGAP